MARWLVLSVVGCCLLAAAPAAQALGVQSVVATQIRQDPPCLTGANVNLVPLAVNFNDNCFGDANLLQGGGALVETDLHNGAMAVQPSPTQGG